jgi:hypothetical protein
MQSTALQKPAALSLCAAVFVTLAGCGSLLPRGTADTPVGFATFADAESAVRRVEALKTPVAQLKELGFDPVQGPNVTLIPYPDIVARLAPYPGVPVDHLDPGIRQCIEAQAACRGYLFHFEHQSRKREGSFWLDFLNLRRHTQVAGWWFDALIVTADGTVLFRNYGGQASTDKVERQVNPLGPFQPAGESAGQLIR